MLAPQDEADTPPEPEPSSGYTPKSYDDALALTAFVDAFVRMLQRGLKLLMHPSVGATKAITLRLSDDCREVSGLRVEQASTGVERRIPSACAKSGRLGLVDGREEAGRGRRAPVPCGVDSISAPTSLESGPHESRGPSLDASLKPRLPRYSVARAVILEPPGAVHVDARFALAFGAGERRNVFVFETANGPTKELLVDGLRLLVERTVARFFDTDEFRVGPQQAPRTPAPRGRGR